MAMLGNEGPKLGARWHAHGRAASARCSVALPIRVKARGRVLRRETTVVPAGSFGTLVWTFELKFRGSVR
jgi:hypothetical protein